MRVGLDKTGARRFVDGLGTQSSMMIDKHCRPPALSSEELGDPLTQRPTVCLIQHIFTECLPRAESKTGHIPPGVKGAYITVREETGQWFTIVCQMLLLPATKDRERGGEGVTARHTDGVCVEIR